MVRLQFPNSDVADVLREYETLTGKRVITDNFVQGKVNIFLSKEVPREEAIQIIKISLLMNGFSLVPEDPDIVKVIGTGKNPRGQGIPIISDQADIPPSDQVVSYLFKLRYADPVELQQVLGQYLSPSRAHPAVDRYVTPDVFDGLGAYAESLGFKHVTSGPLVRSSYHAREQEASGRRA